MLFIALCIGSYYAFRQAQEIAGAKLDTDTDLVLNVLAARLQEYVNAHIGASRVLRNAWQRYGSNDYDQFLTDVLSVSAEFPGFQAISWVDNEHVIRWVYPPGDNWAIVNLNVRTRPFAYAVLQTALANGDMAITPPFTLTQGGHGIVAYLPVQRDGKPGGLIDVAFRVSTLIDHVYGPEIASRFSLRIRDGQYPVAGAPAFDAGPEHIRVRSVRLGDRAWQVELAPRQSMSTGLVSEEMAFAITLIVAIAFSALTYHLLLTRAAHRIAASEATRVANFDDLTGLGNRYRIERRLDAEYRQASEQRKLALLAINVGRTRLINGVYGPHVGDALLRGVAERLAAMHGADKAFRLSGDEFAVVLPDCDGDHARQAATTVVRGLTPPFAIAGLTLEVPCAIGIAIAPAHGDGAKALMRAADTALFAAREDGEHQVLIYDDAMRLQVEEELNLASEIRSALARNEFRLVYQPVIDLRDGALRGFEALVRWHHPVRGLVPTARFISTAERSGLIEPLGRFVLQEACRQAHAWMVEHDRPVEIAVNISPRQLLDLGIVDTVRETLQATGLPARNLTLEITESLVMENIATAATLLDSIKRLNVQISMDDFGTGYSSLSNLTQLPIDLVKIDRSFVHRIGTEPQAASLLEAIIRITRVVGLKVVAEGVETKEQLRILRELQCDYAQGYLFSKPVSADEGAVMLDRRWGDVDAR
ncbi:MAG: EAL domain-containing protein [Gammaproteobacteria bacterium]